MAVVTGNTDVCQGYANCIEEAPSVFRLGDDGLVEVVRDTVDGAEQALAESAVRNCPVSALRVHDA